MIRFLGILLFLLIANLSYCQDKYFISFTDKQESTYSIDSPSEFLSQRSIDRRAKQGIAVTEIDIPVSYSYINQVRETGAKVLYPLKWFNGVVVEVYSSTMINDILNLSFVSSMELIFQKNVKSKPLPEIRSRQLQKSTGSTSDFYEYGFSTNQVKMLNGHVLHNNGFRGQNMVIALLDAGYYAVNTLPAFDSLRGGGRILFERDFVNSESDMYQEHTHGMVVLSVMASNIPGQLIGTAPEASYVLLRSEDAGSEQIIEEYNWAAAAELADSLGVDVINSSLGYSQFDLSWQNHSYSSMDGQTTPSARAASYAAQAGILVVVSAGNEGNSSWAYITSPADAIGSLTVGAVNVYGDYAPFSSRGPSYDGRVKPDVVALGMGTAVQTSDGFIGTANGTSLSAPVISGLAACLWQAFPDLNVSELANKIVSSASSYNNPTTTLGYGLPNFEKALFGTSSPYAFENRKLEVYPNPTRGQLTVKVPFDVNSLVRISFFSSLGNCVYQELVQPYSNTFEVQLPSGFSPGLYIISLSTGNWVLHSKIVVE